MTDDEMLQRAIAASRALSRRRFMRTSGVAAGAMGLAGLLAACGGDDEGGSSTTTAAGGETDSDRKDKGSGLSGDFDLYHANWTLYIDDETIPAWEAATGLKMKYTEEYNDNNEYFAKIQPILARGDAIDPDIITPTFWLAGRLITLGWLEELPALTNYPANVVDRLREPAWDPEMKYTVPWQSGIAGIAYNRSVTGRDLGSVEDLLDPAFKGKVGLLTEMRDTLGLFAMAEGVKLAKPTASMFDAALSKIETAVADGQIRRFHGNDYVDDLVAGNFAACIGWSGDVAQLSVDNPDIEFVIPESGGTLWSDVMVVPKGAKNVEAAAKWMDFVFDPVNAAKITAYVQYISPVAGVQDQLRSAGGDTAALADNPLLFPDDATSARLQSWGNLSEDDEATLDEAFSALQGN